MSHSDSAQKKVEQDAGWSWGSLSEKGHLEGQILEEVGQMEETTEDARTGLVQPTGPTSGPACPHLGALFYVHICAFPRSGGMPLRFRVCLQLTHSGLGAPQGSSPPRWHLNPGLYQAGVEL